jgi:hypothetical protein
MSDHDLRRQRLKAPNAVSTTAAPPSSNHGPRLPGPGGLRGPVEASAVPTDGEIDGANACIAGDGSDVGGIEAGGVASATWPAGVAALREGEAAVDAGGEGQTWLNETVGGRIPVPMEYVQPSTSPSLTVYPSTPVGRDTQPLPV